MGKYNTVNFLFFITAILCMPKLVKPDGIANFVENKINDFGTWLTENNLDPSPVLKGPRYDRFSTIFFELDFEFLNIFTQGHSRNISFQSVDADLPAGILKVYFDINHDVLLSGQYKVNGTLQPNRLIRHEGKWHLTIPRIRANGCVINFEVSPSGNFHLTNFAASYAVPELKDVYFENLSESLVLAGYEEIFRQEIRKRFNGLANSNENPVSNLLKRYWQEILGKTTLADIMGSASQSEITKPSRTHNTMPKSTASDNQKLKEFVMEKHMNYTTWIWYAGLDPSPTLPGPSHFRAINAVVKLDVYLENHGFSGLIGASFSSRDVIIEADMEKRHFSIDF